MEVSKMESLGAKLWCLGSGRTLPVVSKTSTTIQLLYPEQTNLQSTTKGK